MKTTFIVLGLLLLLVLIFSLSFNTKGAKYLILLGSGLHNDQETFVMLRRVNRAALYLSQNPECLVVVSGGITGNSSVSEASVMKRMLKDRHIEEERIIVEDKSHNTRENMLFSKALIDTNESIVVCSSDYHVFRAKLLAIKYGYSCRSIYCQSTLIELLVHLPIELFCIIKDLLVK